MTLLDTACLALFTVMLAGGQILFKHVGLVMHGRSGASAFLVVLLAPSLYAALALYGFATLLWIWILSRVPLSQAYPWVAAGMIIVPLLGWLIFGEHLSRGFWLGVTLILAGIAITQISVDKVQSDGKPAVARPQP